MVMTENAKHEGGYNHDLEAGTAGSIRSSRFTAERSATVTKYEQHWSVLPLTSSKERVVHAKMSIDYLVTAGTYTSNFKSLLDASHIKSVGNVRVVEMSGATAIPRRQDLWERDGYTFVTWYYDYDNPVTAGEVVSIVVEYDIYGAVSGCSLPAVESSLDDGEDVTSDDATICRESFAAPWANYWSIPVEDIAYTFELPTDDNGITYSQDSLLLDEPAQCCSSVPEVNGYQDGATIYKQDFQMSELGIGRSQPKNVVYNWDLTDPMQHILHCRDVCKNQYGSYDNEDDEISPLIWLTLLIPALAIFGGLFVYCKRKKHANESDGSRIIAGKLAPESTKRDAKGGNGQEKQHSNVPIASAVAVPVASVQEKGKSAALDGGSTCAICFSRRVDATCVPCGHRAVCMTCGITMRNCPICRSSVEDCLQSTNSAYMY
eukprot:CAMPEP_0197728824 /NCGR_PEP_ID=MMETSP1434-20131217/28337_1 /TAXON_ID=265543 /ORGANISM="Minutocellus polymorphus, Strain CCMP3303" /LENGTH=432 /DNA_ID=CAMNT_0043315355 /DNA_START=93 /DNA_END=1391 /DNA_ORIENTATION=+